MARDGALFTREDAVEAAWTVIDPVLATHPRAQPYAAGTWGPEDADKLIAPYGRWHNPCRPPDDPATGNAASDEVREPPRRVGHHRPTSTQPRPRERSYS